MTNNWKPIETAPKDGTEILTFHNGCYSVREWGKNEDGDEVWLPRIRGFFPTHWMPLPKPPEETRKEGKIENPDGQEPFVMGIKEEVKND